MSGTPSLFAGQQPSAALRGGTVVLNRAKASGVPCEDRDGGGGVHATRGVAGGGGGVGTVTVLGHPGMGAW